MESLEQRIERLERQNRLFKRAAGILLVLGTVAVLIGAAAPRPKTLSADTILVKDSDGKERIYLGMNDNDEPVITFFSPDAAPLFTIDSRGPGQVVTSTRPNYAWAWPKKKSARLWDLTIWFQRPAKGGMQKFHKSVKCSHLQSAVRTGAVDGKKVTKQKLNYAYKHFADQLEPCVCCIGLFPAD